MDEFAEDIIRNSVDLCNHRGSNKLEPKDGSVFCFILLFFIISIFCSSLRVDKSNEDGCAGGDGIWRYIV